MGGKDLRIVVSRNIRTRREELDMTQTALARAVGVTPACISQIEADKRTLDVEALARLAEALRTSPSALLSTEPIFSPVPT